MLSSIEFVYFHEIVECDVFKPKGLLAETGWLPCSSSYEFPYADQFAFLINLTTFGENIVIQMS